jgi:DUF971 family protein
MAEEVGPLDIRQAGPKELEITWSDDHVSRYSVAYLRRACRCAACVDEWTGAQLLSPDQVSDDVKPVRIEPVGRYAIHFAWSDGHSSGIYSFEHLRNICPCPACTSG